MNCPTCATPLAAEARFCGQCGQPVGGLAPSWYPGFEPGCGVCGGEGARLAPERDYCPGCRWLRPLAPGYDLPVEAYLWRLDADAMNVLASLGPLTTAAQMVSERVGRPWFEASVNGLRLSERQLPDIFALAIRAARVLGLPYLPEIYVSGENMWDAMTLGTATSSFIVLGSVLTNFKGDDLLFLLGREMGHCRAGHALWKTVSQFVSGRAHRHSLMGDGVLKMLNPAKLVESAVDMPLMAWARHAEITADRAGYLVVGREEVARRVLQTWTFRSFPLLTRLDAAAWQDQESESDPMSMAAEWALSSTPYIAGRLRNLREFVAAEDVQGWRAVIQHWLPPLPPPLPAPAAGPPRPLGPPAPPPPPDPNTLRLVCVSCKEPMRIPKAALEGKELVNVRCPNAACRTVLAVRPRKAETPAPAAGTNPGAPAAGAPPTAPSVANPAPPPAPVAPTAGPAPAPAGQP